MKFPTDRPVKVVMLGAGGTGGYPQLLETLSALRKNGCRYERTA